MPARPNEPTWLSRIVVDAIHIDQIREHGGPTGLRDENSLESALARAQHQWLYEDVTDLADLAAAYGFALACNQKAGTDTLLTLPNPVSVLRSVEGGLERDLVRQHPLDSY